MCNVFRIIGRPWGPWPGGGGVPPTFGGDGWWWWWWWWCVWVSTVHVRQYSPRLPLGGEPLTPVTRIDISGCWVHQESTDAEASAVRYMYCDA